MLLAESDTFATCIHIAKSTFQQYADFDKKKFTVTLF